MQNLELVSERSDQVKLFSYSFLFWSVLFSIL